MNMNIFVSSLETGCLIKVSEYRCKNELPRNSEKITFN